MLRSSCSVVLVLMLIGCAESPPPEPVHPQPHADQQAAYVPPPPPPDYSAQQREQQLAAEKQAAALQAAQKQIEEQVHGKEAEREEQREKVRRGCEQTRGKRAVWTQSAVKLYLANEKRLESRSKEIRATCRLTAKATGNVTVQRSGGSGLRVSAEKQEGLSCPKGPPAGLTEQDVYYYLSSRQPGAPDTSGLPIVDTFELEDSRERRDVNRGCREGDLAAGLDTEVKAGDAEGLKRFLEWKPAE